MPTVQLTRNIPTTKPKVDKVGFIKNPTFDQLKAFAFNKMKNVMKLNKKKVRLFVRKGSIVPPSTEITLESDLNHILTKDILIAVSNGVDYQSRKKLTGAEGVMAVSGLNSLPPHSHAIAKLLSSPPETTTLRSKVGRGVGEHDCSPVGRGVGEHDCSPVGRGVGEHDCSPDCSPVCSPEFPYFKDNVIGKIRTAIAENPKITEFENIENGYISFDYEDDCEFMLDGSEQDLIQRECRGLIVSSTTGEVIARRFHKFFNINQNEISDEATVDFESNFHKYRIYQKLDGSLVSPIPINSTEYVWATRRSTIEINPTLITPSIKSLVENCISKGYTPLFEYCVTNRGLIVCDEDSLTLLTIRNNKTGEYILLETLGLGDDDVVHIPITKEYDTSEIGSFSVLCREIKKAVNDEGVVLYSPDGNLYKLKSDWYVDIMASNKFSNFLANLLKLKSQKGTVDGYKHIQSHRIWLTALQNHDDTIAQCSSLSGSMELHKFVREVSIGIQHLERDMRNWVITTYKSIGDKKPIVEACENIGWNRWIVDDVLNNTDCSELLTKIRIFCTQFAKKKNIPMLNELLGVSWNESAGIIDQTDVEAPELITFEKCRGEIRDHVLESYMPRKLSQLLGTKITDDTRFTLPPNYIEDEGKIKGLWEQFTKNDIWDLRVDLQAPLKKPYTAHNGNPDYGLLLVQYGLFLNDSKKPHGDFAGILIPTDQTYKCHELISAMAKSFETRHIVKLHRPLNSIQTISQTGSSQQEYEIFCDLDEVLADFSAGVEKTTGRKITDQTPDKMWQRILSKAGFFQNLSEMENAQTLWTYLCNGAKMNKFSKRITILTGTPMTCKKQVTREKKKWVKNHIESLTSTTDAEIIVDTIVTQSKDKYKWSGPNKILIDDNYNNCSIWSKCGGIAIFYQNENIERAIYELDRLTTMKKEFSVALPKFDRSEISEYEFDSSDNTVLIDSAESVFPDTGSMVAVDAEWNPTDKTNEIALIQIATDNGKCYLFDMITLPFEQPMIIEKLYQLFDDPSITKLMFGSDIEDLNRIGCNINSVVDIQEYLMNRSEMFNNSNHPSLKISSEILLNKTINKTKEYQTSNWNLRPLSMEQIQYASIDACILFDMYTALVPFGIDKIRKNLVYTKKQLKQGVDDFEPSIPVKMIYAGVFVPRDQITKRFPPIHPTTYADHVTMMYRPTEMEMRGFPVGKLIELTVTHVYQDQKLQVLRVTLGEQSCFPRETETPSHITVSTRNTDPKEANSIMERTEGWTKVEPEFKVLGKYGIQFQQLADPLVVLPQKVRTKIEELVETGMRGSHCKFKAGELTSSQRSIIHEYANNLGILSESSGKKEMRQLILTIRSPPKSLEDTELDDDAVSGKRIRITDSYRYAIVNIVDDRKTYDPTVGIVSTTDNEVIWTSNKIVDFEPVKPTIFILRGLSGSGKSTLAKILGYPVCSADMYFTKTDKSGSEYEFDLSLLPKAHEYCYSCAEAIVTNERESVSLTIDNTNSTLSEINKYVKLAEEHGYATVVLEMYCKDRKRAYQYQQRNTHNVSANDVLKMLSRWQTYDSAILLSNELDQDTTTTTNSTRTTESFYQWLENKHVIHFNKKRNITHLMMAVGTYPARFLDISNKLRDEFVDKYLENAGEPKYLAEYIQTSKDFKFRMFVDIDHKETISTAVLHQFAKTIASVTDSNVIVIGCVDMGKMGVHIHCYDCIVDLAKSKQLYEQILSEITKLTEIDNEYLECLDDTVYMKGRGIRMLYSRKVTNTIDKGRVYEYMFNCDSKGNISKKQYSKTELLQKTSILI
jgi:predicted kinase